MVLWSWYRDNHRRSGVATGSFEAPPKQQSVINARPVVVLRSFGAKNILHNYPEVTKQTRRGNGVWMNIISMKVAQVDFPSHYHTALSVATFLAPSDSSGLGTTERAWARADSGN